MFHFHNWVEFVGEEEFRKCTKCGKIESLIGVAGYDSMWREVSPKNYSKETIEKINNEFNKKTGHKPEKVKEELEEVKELNLITKKYDKLVKSNKKIKKENKELKEKNEKLNKYNKFEIIDI